MFGFDVRIARLDWTGSLVAFFLFVAYPVRSPRSPRSLIEGTADASH